MGLNGELGSFGDVQGLWTGRAIWNWEPIQAIDSPSKLSAELPSVREIALRNRIGKLETMSAKIGFENKNE